MYHDMKRFFREILASPQRRAIPIMTTPGIELTGAKPAEVFRSGELQFRCIEALAGAVHADALVTFMDLSVEAEAFGSVIRVSDDEVPTVIGAIASDEEEAKALKVPEIGAGRTGLYIKAIEKAAQLITDRPVLAGIIGPFSLTGRLIDVNEAMIKCYEEPEMVHTVLEKTTQFLIEYAKAYKSAGANGIVIAEPLAGLLSPDLTEEFSEPYVKRIVDAVQDDEFAVVYHNCGDCTIRQIDSILRTGALAYHFGNSIDMSEMMKHIPAGVLAMGNVDPAAQFRNGTPESIKAETKRIMGECCRYPNFVISSGCDIPPMSPWENIDAFFEAAAEFYGDK